MNRGEIIEVSPFRCRLWESHERLEDYITEETCKEEIDSFLTHGQMQPAIARRIENSDGGVEYEVMCGARRLFVARHIGVPLLAEVKELTNREAAVHLDIDNRLRRDISPYERGRSFARWIASEYFASQEDIARSMGMSTSRVSRLLQIGRLPSVVVSAFTSPTEIRETWGVQLHFALENASKRSHVVAEARKISAVVPRPAADEVFTRLMNSAIVKAKRIKRSKHDEIVPDISGHSLFRVAYRQKTVAVVFNMDEITATTLGRIKEAISLILVKERASNGVIAFNKDLVKHYVSQAG